MNPTPDLYTSPLEALSNGRFGGKTYVQEKVLSLSTTRSTLIPNNPNRVFWIVQNEGVTDARVSIDPAITVASGWLLAANGGQVSMFWEEDGEAVGYEVFIIAASGTPNVRVREVIRL